MNLAYSIAVQPDGKIVAAGGAGMYTVGGSDNQFAIARYHCDGTLDRNFGHGGRVVDGYVVEAHDLAIRRNGSILVVGSGTYGGKGEVALASYKRDGSRKPTFDGTGWVDGPWLGRAYSVGVQTDGMVVIAGQNDDGFALARYGAAGIDHAFGQNGFVTTSFGGDRTAARALAIQDDGKIVAVGRALGALAIARYDPSGQLDPAFGQGGLVISDFGTGSDSFYAVAVQRDGKILASGQAGGAIILARYNVDGSPDRTFGEGGRTVTDLTSRRDSSHGLAIQNDGKIVVAGGLGDDRGFVVIRYHRDGSLDTDFGRDGIATAFLGTGGVANAVAIQPDGRILVAGREYHMTSRANFALARFLGA